MRTLADMTKEERAKYRGMWCEIPLGNALFIYVADDQRNPDKAVVVNPTSQFRTVTPLHALTPRTDLIRAWTPSGAPINNDVHQAATVNNRSLHQAIGKIAAGATTARDEILKKLSARQG